MTHHPPSALLSAALRVAERGCYVFPLRPGDKRPALHGETACPRTGPCTTSHLKWEQRATTDPARIRAAWSTGAWNIGIATGPSGLVVIDLDRPKPHSSTDTPSGVNTFEALCERAGHPVPTTYRTRTASRGHHLYFTTPPGTRLGNTVGTLAPLVDTRAWGGYVVAPGSSTPGGRYEVTDPVPVAPLPDWLLTLLRPAPRGPVGPLAMPVVSGSRAGRAALERECWRVAAAPEREGNDTLNRSAFKVGRFVAWGDLARHEVEEAFQGAGEARGLTAAECRATIRSALDASIRTARPRETA